VRPFSLRSHPNRAGADAYDAILAENLTTISVETYDEIAAKITQPIRAK
jgi:hypothetical protein